MIDSQCIYLIRSKVNKKVYIGKTMDSIKRLPQHKRKLKINKHHNRYLQRHYNKYTNGNFEDVFEYTILEDSIKESEIGERERYWISVYDATNRKKGFNMTIGGEITGWSEDVLKRRIKSFIEKNIPRFICMIYWEVISENIKQLEKFQSVLV